MDFKNEHSKLTQEVENLMRIMKNQNSDKHFFTKATTKESYGRVLSNFPQIHIRTGYLSQSFFNGSDSCRVSNLFIA